MRQAILGVTLVLAALSACGVDNENPAIAQPSTDGGAFADDGLNTSGVGAGTGANTGLPCDVQQLLENRCIGCHLAGSTYPLLTFDDLVAKSRTNPAQTMAQRSLERIQSPQSPMPPAPAEPPTAEEIQTFSAWVAAGTQRGAACTGAVGDAGAPPSYATPTVCTSGSNWTRGNDESSSMRPGGACITCHTKLGGPAFKVAGTIYPTAHEPNDCNGSGAGLTVVVTDANGTVTNITVNNVGNFSARGQIVPPFHVKVTNGTKERAMSAALTAGDCNSCHTVTGANGAPGRILAP